MQAFTLFSRLFLCRSYVVFATILEYLVRPSPDDYLISDTTMAVSTVAAAHHLSNYCWLRAL